jgi:hypothetical protein
MHSPSEERKLFTDFLCNLNPLNTLAMSDLHGILVVHTVKINFQIFHRNNSQSKHCTYSNSNN